MPLFRCLGQLRLAHFRVQFAWGLHVLNVYTQAHANGRFRATNDKELNPQASALLAALDHRALTFLRVTLCLKVETGPKRPSCFRHKGVLTP